MAVIRKAGVDPDHSDRGLVTHETFGSVLQSQPAYPGGEGLAGMTPKGPGQVGRMHAGEARQVRQCEGLAEVGV